MNVRTAFASVIAATALAACASPIPVYDGKDAGRYIELPPVPHTPDTAVNAKPAPALPAQPGAPRASY